MWLLLSILCYRYTGGALHKLLSMVDGYHVVPGSKQCILLGTQGLLHRRRRVFRCVCQRIRNVVSYRCSGKIGLSSFRKWPGIHLNKVYFTHSERNISYG